MYFYAIYVTHVYFCKECAITKVSLNSIVDRV